MAQSQPYADTVGGSTEPREPASTTPAAEQLQEQFKAKAEEAVDFVSAEAKKALADPQKYMQDSKDSIAAYTRAQPLKALAIAAGVAFVAGALSRAGR